MAVHRTFANINSLKGIRAETRSDNFILVERTMNRSTLLKIALANATPGKIFKFRVHGMTLEAKLTLHIKTKEWEIPRDWIGLLICRETVNSALYVYLSKISLIFSLGVF